MGMMTAVMVGLGVTSAATQIIGGVQAKREAEWNAEAVTAESKYNAGVYRQQAGMVEEQKQLKAQQDARKIRFAEGKHVAMTANKGIELSGSAMGVLVDTLTQMEMDKAISAYNFDVEKYALRSQAVSTERRGYTLASQYRSGGRTAMTAGLVGGLTTLAATGFYASQRINTSGGAKKGSGT